MNRTAIAFLTKDSVELSRRTIEPLAQPDQFDLWWCDGSSIREGKDFFASTMFRSHTPSLAESKMILCGGVRGGADAAIVYALTKMLDWGMDGQRGLPYEYVGLCENDVLLPSSANGGWFDRTMHLFEQGRQEGLNVGAVSPRCYEDRILIQRDGYAVMHNLGAGIVIFTREAARLILDNYRTAWSTDNRNIFCQLSGIDIGTYWAFRANQQWLTADWGFDAILAKHGLASLALTPSPVEMIGQTPSLAEQGLTLAGPDGIPTLRNNAAFDTYRRQLAKLWEGQATITTSQAIHQDSNGVFTIFPHQIHKLLPASGGQAGYAGDWRLKWSQGFGPFAWRSSSPGDSLIVPLAGHVELLVSGGTEGGKVEVVDEHSGFTCSPVLSAEGGSTQVMSIAVPSGVSYREVRLTALTAGVVFYGIRTREPQMLYHGTRFDHSFLPPCPPLADGGG